MQKNPLSDMVYESINLAPYVSSVITIQGGVVATRISEKTFLIAFNGITSATQSYDSVLFSNLPFRINQLAVSWLFANPANSGEFNASTRCMLVGSGTEIRAAHPVMGNLFYGQLVVTVD